MVIKNLYLEHFGRFHEREIMLKPGLNLVYGRNESGKSTLHSFIRGMLFGIGKNRGREGKNSRYSAYLPWDTPSLYGGAMEIGEGEEEYRLYRSFYKETREDRCVRLRTGEEVPFTDGRPAFLPEGFYQVLFDNTVSMEQDAQLAKKDLAEQLKNYIANLSTSGDHEVDIDLAVRQLKEEKKRLRSSEVRDRLSGTERKIDELELKEQQLKGCFQEYRRMSKECEAEASLIRDLDRRIKEQEAEGIPDEYEADTGNKRGKRGLTALIPYIISASAALLAGIVTKGAVSFLMYGAAVLLVCTGAAGFLTARRKWTYLSQQKTKQQENLKDAGRKRSEITAALKRDRALCIKRQEERKECLEQLRTGLEQLESATAELDRWNRQRDELAERCREEEENAAALDLAIDTITRLSAHIQTDFGVLLNRRLSAVVSDVTDGKYNNIYIEDELGMKAECGRHIQSLEQLSRGTVEQFGLTLRISVIDVLYPGIVFPVLLDDSLAYYDDIRMGYMLEWLAGLDHQIILFTCQEREKRFLDRRRIPYHYLELE